MSNWAVLYEFISFSLTKVISVNSLKWMLNTVLFNKEDKTNYIFKMELLASVSFFFSLKQGFYVCQNNSSYSYKHLYGLRGGHHT